MATEVVTIRLSKEDVKYIEEYAAQLRMKKAPFLQSLVAAQLAVLRKEPMPERLPEKVTEKEKPAPAPNRTSFWRAYRAEVKSHPNQESLLGHPRILFALMEEIFDELEPHAKEYPHKFLACIKLKLQVLGESQNISKAFETAKRDALKKMLFSKEIQRMLLQLTDYKRHELIERYKRGEHPDRLLGGIQRAAKL